jgi:uncharacterized protein YerC
MSDNDQMLTALYKFFKDDAKMSDVEALEAAQSVVKLKREGQLDEVLKTAREGNI